MDTADERASQTRSPFQVSRKGSSYYIQRTSHVSRVVYSRGHPLAGNTSHLSPKGGKTRQESSGSGKIPERKKTRSFLMYRLRDMDLDDKVCEQVEMTMISTVYPKEVITRCVQDSQPWSSKARRVRQSTAVALGLFGIGMALGSRLSHCQVWHKLVGKLSDLHPGQPDSELSDAALSGRRKALGSQCLQALMHACW